MKKVFFSLLVVLIAVTGAYAQRQTPGRFSLEAYGGIGKGVIPDSPEIPVFIGMNNAGIALSYYDYSGRMVYGLDAFMQPHTFVDVAIYDREGNEIAPEESHAMTSVNYCVSAGYLYRLWGLRSRTLTLSVGGSLFIGASVCEQIASYYKEPTSSDFNSPVGFYMALAPEVQLECFPFRNMSLFASFKPRMRFLDTLAGKSDWLLANGTFGLKYYF